MFRYCQFFLKISMFAILVLVIAGKHGTVF